MKFISLKLLTLLTSCKVVWTSLNCYTKRSQFSRFYKDFFSKMLGTFKQYPRSPCYKAEMTCMLNVKYIFFKSRKAWFVLLSIKKVIYDKPRGKRNITLINFNFWLNLRR